MDSFFTAAELEPYSRSITRELTPKCGACGLYRNCKSPKMKPWGRGALGILIVGTSPGDTDDQLHKPFMGEDGQLLREVIGQLGVDFEDLKITNSIICHPPHDKMPKKGKEVGWCRPNLIHTIEGFAPSVIITLGRHALESVIQDHWRSDIGVLERWVGAQIPLGTYWVCPTWHPSYLLREQNIMRERMFREHLEAALAIDTAPEVLPDFSTRIEKLYNEREIIQALRSFDQPGASIAFDYETNCLKPEYPQARIFSCAVSNGRRTVAYPWHGKAMDATSVLLQSSRTFKIAANMKFEERWTLKHLDHPVTNWDWDTMLATHAKDNRTAVCSLKFQAFVQLGVPTYSDKAGPYLATVNGTHYNRIHELDLGLLLHYNGMDALLEWHLARKQQRAFGGSFSSWRRKVESSYLSQVKIGP